MVRKVATEEHVERAQLEAFVRERSHVLLVTYRRDGRPQASPVTAGMDEQGRLVVATYPKRAKTRNLRRDPRASAVVLSDDFDGPWVQLYGTAEVLDVPEAVEGLVAYYRAVAGEHPDWDEYRRAMRDQGKSLLRIRVDEWGPIATGGFPRELV